MRPVWTPATRRRSSGTAGDRARPRRRSAPSADRSRARRRGSRTGTPGSGGWRSGAGDAAATVGAAPCGSRPSDAAARPARRRERWSRPPSPGGPPLRCSSCGDLCPGSRIAMRGSRFCMRKKFSTNLSRHHERIKVQSILRPDTAPAKGGGFFPVSDRVRVLGLTLPRERRPVRQIGEATATVFCRGPLVARSPTSPTHLS